MPQACNFIKKETPTQVFSCKFCEIFNNTFFTEHLRASEMPISHCVKNTSTSGYMFSEIWNKFMKFVFFQIFKDFKTFPKIFPQI